MTQTLVRKAATGEPGNRGEFGRTAREESAVALGGRDETADRSDIDRYFAGGVDDIVMAPWVDHGVYPTYDARYWGALPAIGVDPRGLRRTQSRIFAKHLKRAAAGDEPDGGDLPWIVRFDGEDYAIDGHHRIANAVHNGHPNIAVKLLDLGGPEDI